MKRLLSIATLYPNPHQPRFGTFVARQMEALAARGDWDVTVINPIGVPPVAAGRYKPLAAAAVTGAEHGVTVHRPRFTLIPAVGGPFNPRMIVRAVLPLAQRLHALAPFDLVDAQFFYPDGPAAARIAAALGLPLSIKARGADISFWGHKAYALRKMKHAAAQAAGLLAVSEALAGDMAAIGLPRDKITVHYTGLDRSLFRPHGRARSRARLAQEFGFALPAGAPLLATVGALIPRKGQQFVIRALARLPSAHLALVGTGPDRARARGAGARGGARRARALPRLARPHAAAGGAVGGRRDGAAFGERGLANAWVEALACGCPLVITEAGGARELVTRPEAGRIVARDADAIAAAVRELLDAPPAREAVAECAARFSWEANAAALAEYYEGLLAKSSPLAASREGEHEPRPRPARALVLRVGAAFGRHEAVLRHPEPDQDRRRHVDRAVSADEDAERDRRGEAEDHVGPEHQQRDQRDQQRGRGHDGARQRLVDRQVEQLGQRHLAVLLQVLADAVVDHDGVVERVADQREDRGDDVEVELHPGQREHAERQRHVVRQREQRADAELPFEAHPDVDRDADHRQRERDHAGAEQLVGDLARDRPRGADLDARVVAARASRGCRAPSARRAPRRSRRAASCGRRSGWDRRSAG